MRNLEAGFRGANGHGIGDGRTPKTLAASCPSLASIEPGSPVFCVNGTDIGRIAAVLSDAFVLERGSFQERETYRIPATAVAHVAGTRVVLNIGCQELERFRTS